MFVFIWLLIFKVANFLRLIKHTWSFTNTFLLEMSCLSSDANEFCTEDQPSNGSDASSDTIRRPRDRKLTPISVCSLRSISPSPLRVRNENLLPQRDPVLDLKGKNQYTEHTRVCQQSHKCNHDNDDRCFMQAKTSSTSVCQSLPIQDIDPDTRKGRIDSNTTPNLYSKQKYSIHTRPPSESANQAMLLKRNEVVRPIECTDSMSAPAASMRRSKHQLKHLISHLRLRTSKSRKSFGISRKQWTSTDSKSRRLSGSTSSTSLQNSRYHSTRSAISIKSLSVSNPSTHGLNDIARPRRSRRSALFSKGSGDSRKSQGINRTNADSGQTPSYLTDELTLESATQCRQTLEELVSSEESYIADLKILVNVRTIRHFGEVANLIAPKRPI